MTSHSMTLTSAARRWLLASIAAALALVAIGFANNAHARDNVTFSVGIGVPGVVFGASNAYPVYSQPQAVYVQPQPVYIQPRPIYVQPAPVYYQPAPVYYSPQVYVAPRPMYYGQPYDGKHGHYKKHGWKNQEYYSQGYQHQGYQHQGHQQQGYGPVYYQR